MMPSTFWLRLRLNMKALLGRLWWLVAGGFVLPTLMLFVTFMGDGWPFELGRLEVFLLAAAANVGLIVGASVVTTTLRSLVPSAHEQFLPRAITFCAESLRVEPRGSPPFDDSYGFVLSATRTALGLDLKIGEKPLLVLHITPQMIGAEPFALMQLWLVHHGKLVG